MFSICHMLYLSLNAWSPSLVYSRLNTFTTVTYTLHRLVQCVRPKYLVAQRHMSFRTYVYHNWFYLYPLPCLFVVFKVSTGIDKLDINLVLVACVVDCVGQFVFSQNSHWCHPLHTAGVQCTQLCACPLHTAVCMPRPAETYFYSIWSRLLVCTPCIHGQKTCAISCIHGHKTGWRLNKLLLSS